MAAPVLLDRPHPPAAGWRHWRIYFAMGFSIFVETINLRIRPAHAPVRLHEPYQEDPKA